MAKQNGQQSPNTTAGTYRKGDTQVLKGGKEIPAAKVDSIKAANPALGKVIGNPFRSSDGSMAQYGDDQSDAIKAAMGWNKN